MATWKGGPKPPPRVVAPNKLWHAFKHKNLDVFKCELVPFFSLSKQQLSHLFSLSRVDALSANPLAENYVCVTGAM